MKIIKNPPFSEWESILKRPTQSFETIESTIADVFDAIKTKGDKALLDYTSKFDKVVLEQIKVSLREVKEAENLVSQDLKHAIDLAKANIEKFHLAQRTDKVYLETSEGVECWQEKRPIAKVGLYIPGGTAPLLSTVLMLAVPAQIAGCQEVILCSPPNSKGNIHPTILYTAKICGITEIFKVGGSQAIAGLTFGTESLPRVYKIFGPGNQFVTAAKQYATKFGVAIDMPAGPSELLVLADDSANPTFVAADLLSQAEHGVDSQVVLVSLSRNLIQAVQSEVKKQLEKLPRKAIAEKALANSKFILLESKKTALRLINEYAPEHLIICTKNNNFYSDNIQDAGSVFIGNYTPESAGDYASGTNHTLPTNAFAKAYSGVNLDSFMKSMTFQKISPKGLQTIGKAIELMAEAEELQAHKNAVSLRLEYLKNTKK